MTKMFIHYTKAFKSQCQLFSLFYIKVTQKKIIGLLMRDLTFTSYHLKIIN